MHDFNRGISFVKSGEIYIRN